MKITDQTTLAELEIEKQRLGITHFLVSERPRPKRPITIEHLVDVSIVSDDGMIQTSAGSWPEAINQAFEKREAEIGMLIVKEQA